MSCVAATGRIVMVAVFGSLCLGSSLIGCASQPTPAQQEPVPEHRIWHCDQELRQCGVVDVEQFEELCDDGSSRACHELGRAHFHDSRLVDTDTAHRGLERACELGRPVACAQLADWYYADQDGGDAPRRAAELFGQACDGGVEQTCHRRGRSVETGAGVEQDLAEALRYYRSGCNDRVDEACEHLDRVLEEQSQQLLDTARSGCDGGDAERCAVLGLLYRAGIEVEADLERALQLFENSCDDGSPLGCEIFGQLRANEVSEFDELSETPDDPPDTFYLDPSYFEYLAVACEGGDGYICGQAAQGYLGGMVDDEDGNTTTELLERACSGGWSRACEQLSSALEREESADIDVDRTVDFLSGQCAVGDRTSCTSVARIFLEGRGVGIDYPRAYNAFRVSCDKGDMVACTSVGAMHAMGQGVAVDYDVAYHFYDRACDGEVPRACANQGSMYMFGQGRQRDLDRARELFDWACQRGEQQGCERLEAVEQAW